MRVAVCTRPNHVELQERPLPEIDHEKVLIRVKVCGICGSDLALWRGAGHQQYPYSPGHEFCGIIEKTGSDLSQLAPGQRVVVNPNLGCGDCPFCRMGRPNLCDYLKGRPIKSNGGLADYVSLDYRMVHPLADELPDELAPFVEPLSCALHVAERARVQGGEQVAIFGAGLFGRLAALALKRSPCRLVFVEPSQKRCAEVARLFQVDALSPAEMEQSALVGQIDVAINCSGSAQAVALAVQALRKAGRLVLAGLVTEVEGAADCLLAATTKELEIVGAWLNPHTFGDALDLALQRKDFLANLEVQIFRLDEVQHAFEFAAGADAAKVLVRP